jgi:hypothetical protein
VFDDLRILFIFAIMIHEGPTSEAMKHWKFAPLRHWPKAIWWTEAILSRLLSTDHKARLRILFVSCVYIHALVLITLIIYTDEIFNVVVTPAGDNSELLVTIGGMFSL